MEKGAGRRVGGCLQLDSNRGMSCVFGRRARGTGRNECQEGCTSDLLPDLCCSRLQSTRSEACLCLVRGLHGRHASRQISIRFRASAGCSNETYMFSPRSGRGQAPIALHSLAWLALAHRHEPLAIRRALWVWGLRGCCCCCWVALAPTASSALTGPFAIHRMYVVYCVSSSLQEQHRSLQQQVPVTMSWV